MENEKQIARIEEQIQQIETKIKDPNLCDGSARTYSRITGYYRPIQGAWNAGKAEEYRQRVEYDLKTA
jgi:anaerobic ribonucleoside-triphosphate reductase